MRTSTLMVLGGVALLLLAAGQTAKPQQVDRWDPSKPPSQVPRPDGWKGYAGTVSDEMKLAAKSALAEPLGSLVPGGTIAETGKAWAVFLEWHYHPPGQGFSAEGWHKGATLLVQR